MNEEIAKLEKAWREFSEDYACAQFLEVNDHWLAYFGAWLLDRARGDRG